MFRVIPCAALLALCISMSFAQVGNYSDPAKLKDLQSKAERGNPHAQYELGILYEFGDWVPKNIPEAVKWLDKSASGGDLRARQELGGIYFEGRGVPQDFNQAARWFGCAKPASAILASCRSVSYNDLPGGVVHILKLKKCDVGPGSNYDYGSIVNLGTDGSSAYDFCCWESAHGPCGALVIAKVGGKWRDTTDSHGLLGFDVACGDFVVLEAQHNGFHDVCIPDQCSTAQLVTANSCRPTIWSFSNNRYRSVTSLERH